MRAKQGRTTPAPRLVACGLFEACASVVSFGVAVSAALVVVDFFLAFLLLRLLLRASVAGRRAALGASTPAKRNNGNLGGGIRMAIRAKNCTGVITRCVAPFLRGFRSR